MRHQIGNVTYEVYPFFAPIGANFDMEALAEPSEILYRLRIAGRNKYRSVSYDVNRCAFKMRNVWYQDIVSVIHAYKQEEIAP